MAVGSLYVRNHFVGSARDAALEMVKHIHQEFNIMLGEVEWMDDKTKSVRCGLVLILVLVAKVRKLCSL